MKLLSYFGKREPDEIWVTSASVLRDISLSTWESFFLELEDNVGGPLDALDKNDPVRRRVIGHSAQQAAEYVMRITRNGSVDVFGERFHDGFTISIRQFQWENFTHLNMLLARPYVGDIDDLMDWSIAGMKALVDCFEPFTASIDLRSRQARLKKKTLLGKNDISWIRGCIPRLGWTTYFGPPLMRRFHGNFFKMGQRLEPFGKGVSLCVSERIDRVDEMEVDQFQRTIGGADDIQPISSEELIQNIE
jgi:hypothetical protein